MLEHDIDARPAEGRQLVAQHPTAGDLDAFAEAHQPEHDLSGHLVGVRIEAGYTAPRPAGRAHLRLGPWRYADGSIAWPCRRSKRLGERALQQWQGAAAIGHVGDDLGHEAGLEPHPNRGRAVDGCSNLLRGHRGDDLGADAQQLADAAMVERPVVEVGAQRHEHPQMALGVLDGGGQRAEERDRSPRRFA